MGYMGLDSWGASDTAFDLTYEVMDEIAKVLLKGLDDKGNEYNTQGFVNVALFFEAFVLPVAEEYSNHRPLREVAIKTIYLLKTHRDKLNKTNGPKKKKNSALYNWRGDDNLKEHLLAYDRMLASLDKFLNIK